MCLRSASNKRPESNANYTSHSEDRHRNTAILLTPPDIRYRATNDIDTDRAGTATEESSHDQGRKVRRRGGGNEPDKEQDVAGEVAGHAAGVLGQRHEEQREYCCADVPGCCSPVQPWEVVLTDAELSLHLHVAGAVRSSRETGQDGADRVLAVLDDFTIRQLPYMKHVVRVKIHLRFTDQLKLHGCQCASSISASANSSYGFSGSLGPSQSTISTSPLFSESPLVAEDCPVPLDTFAASPSEKF